METAAKLRFGMIGGAEGSFIGDIHRRAALFDGLGTLVCGCFSRNREKSLRCGLANGLNRDRIYKKKNGKTKYGPWRTVIVKTTKKGSKSYCGK